MRRPQSGNPPALLIDRNQQLLPPVNGAKIIGQRAQLLRIDTVASKQDVASRIGLAKERALLFGELGSGNPEYGRCHGQKIRS
jgi:hypothetical protein